MFPMPYGNPSLEPVMVMTFVVGRFREEFHLPMITLANVSGGLRDRQRAAVMTEHSVIDWSNVEVETFKQLVDFALDGDYAVTWPPDAADPVPGEEPHDSLLARMTRNEDRIGHPYFEFARKEIWKPYDKDPLGRRWARRAARSEATPSWRELLPHVKLYRLADRYGVLRLKKLCVSKVRHTLFRASGGGGMLRSAVVDALRFVYPDTAPGDELRSALLKFLVAEMNWELGTSGLEDVVWDLPGIRLDLKLSIPKRFRRELRFPC